MCAGRNRDVNYFEGHWRKEVSYSALTSNGRLRARLFSADTELREAGLCRVHKEDSQVAFAEGWKGEWAMVFKDLRTKPKFPVNVSHKAEIQY